MILGIIPAGGDGQRWGGTCLAKEMLPISKTETFLDHTICALHFGGADRIMLITNKEKIQMHAVHLGNSVDYRIRRETLWQSIMDSFSYEADWNLFAMPDTYYPKNIFDQTDMHIRDFNIGYFETLYPERFGVIIDGEIYDKQLLGTGEYSAWGVLCWSNLVVEFWLKNLDKIKNHTDAFNLAIKEFGYSSCKMDFYHDMAGWEDYEYYITGLEW